MRRAVIFVENLPVPLDRRVWQEATALGSAGWEVSVVGPRGSEGMRSLREYRDGIEILRYPQRAATGLSGYLVEYLPSLLFSFAWLIWLRMRGPIAVIHGCNPPDLFWLFGIIGRSWGARYVFDQHDVNPELSATKFGSGSLKGRLLQAITTWLERRSYITAALVIAPNDSYASIARQRGGVSTDKLVLVRNAPPVATYRRLAEGVDPDPHRVGYVGVMGSQDGLDILIGAWALVVNGVLKDAHLDLVGDGEARVALEEQVDRLGVRSSVTFHGYQSLETFVPILARASLCISPDPPTPFNDVSTMVKVVDYLALGRPILAFQLAETVRVAGDAVEVVATPSAEALAEAITSLLQDPARLSQLEDAARRRPNELELDWSASARSLIAAYDRVASSAAVRSE